MQRTFAVALTLALTLTPGAAAQAAAPTTTATYTADLTGVFTNPERGFHNRYEIVNDPAVNDYASNTIPGFNPDMLDRTFARAHASGNTLIHSYLHLDKYQTSDLPPALLSNLGTGLAAIRAQGMKLVLRVAYVWDGYSAVTEPQMERHIDQLAPVIAANADVILHLETGFFGAWGEWHSSPYTASSEESQAPVRYRLVKKLLSSTPASLPVLIRYPIFNYEFAQRTTPPAGCPLPDNCLMTTQDKDRLGFHDDCFLADTADIGTYDQNSWLGWFDVSVKKKQWVYDVTPLTPESVSFSGRAGAQKGQPGPEDVRCTDHVGVPGVSAGDTDEVGLGDAVLLGTVPAVRAGAGSVGGVHRNDHTAGAFSLAREHV
jgi:hypothetical protein